MNCNDCNMEITPYDIDGFVFGCTYCAKQCDKCHELKYLKKLHPINKYEDICVKCFKKGEANGN